MTETHVPAKKSLPHMMYNIIAEGGDLLAPTDAQKRASDKYQRENIASLACRVKKEQAEKFKAYCAGQGKPQMLCCVNMFLIASTNKKTDLTVKLKPGGYPRLSSSPCRKTGSRGKNWAEYKFCIDRYSIRWHTNA